MALLTYFAMLSNLFVIIVSSGSTKSEICCDRPDIFDIFWEHTQLFTKDRYANIIITKDASLSFGKMLLHRAMKNCYFPIVYHYFSISEQMPPSHWEPILVSRSLAFNMIVSENPRSCEDRVKEISTLSVRAYIILVFTNTTQEDTNAYLKSVWNNYNMLNIVAFRSYQKSNRNETGIEASFYDPFITGKITTGITHNSILQIEDFKRTDAFWKSYFNRLINVHGYPLRICMFEYSSTSKPVLDSKGNIIKYRLRDGFSVDTLVKAINFNAIYSLPSDGGDYGFSLPNGTLTGSLKDIDEGRADIIGNIRPIHKYGQNNSQFLFPADEAQLVFLVPEMGKTSKISFLGIYDHATLISISASFVALALVWYCLQKLYSSLGLESTVIRTSKMALTEICSVLFGAMLLISQRSHRARYERCLLMSMVFSSIIIAPTFMGKMLDILSASEVSLNINTLEDLAKSNLKIITFSDLKKILRDIAAMNIDGGTYSELYKRQELGDDVIANVRRVYKARDSALMSIHEDCIFYKTLLHSNKTGKSLVHIVDEGLPKRYNSHMVPKNSPFVERFNEVMLHIRESGLMQKCIDDVYYSLKLQLLKKPYEPKTHKIYSRKELDFIFVSWLISCLLCALVFLVEIYLAHYLI